jgi:hypothetical protein
MDIRRYKRRYWAVYSPSEELVCVCVYKKGAQNVVRLLEEKPVLLSQRQARRTSRARRLPSSVQRKAMPCRSLRHAPSRYKRPPAPTNVKKGGNAT